jgi:hypothetical protein
MKAHTLLRTAIALLLGIALIVPGALPALAQPPSNDSFSSAEEISTLPFHTVVDITEATVEPDEQIACTGLTKSIWYRYAPTADTVLQLDLSGSDFYYTGLTVWQENEFGGLNYVTCAWLGDANTWFTANAGQVYYLQAGKSYDEGSNNLHLNVVQIPPPPNNDFDDAQVVGAVPFSDTQDPRAATTEPGEPTPSCAFYPISKTFWYAYTAPVSGSLVTRSDIGFPSIVAVYQGSSLSSLTEVGCSYQSGSFVFSAQAGATYYFQVGQSDPYFFLDRISFFLDVPPPPVAQFSYEPLDPSLFDSIQFSDGSYDPAGGAILSSSWNFGDGATATGCCPTHQYAADGDYAVTLTIVTVDGRTATTTQNVQVRTHDVAITKFTVPNAASAGQTRTVVVGINSRRYDETVSVTLLKSNPGDPWNPWWTVGVLTQFVPVRPANRTTDFTFSYTFTEADAGVGKVTFKAVAQVLTGRDALPADNEAIAPPTKVSRKGGKSADGAAASAEQNEQIFLPLVANR